MRYHLVCLTLLATAACRDRIQPPPPMQPPLVEANRTGQKQRQLAHCPSAVTGASTRMATTTGGVDLLVTATTPAATAEITARARAAEHLQRLGAPLGPTKHDGQHGGPGTIGYCPLVRAGTVFTVDAVPDGVLIHVQPLEQKDLEALRTTVRERVEALVVPSS
jgi:hypothetical protein